MKKSIYLILFILLGYAVYSQQNFEGTIEFETVITGNNAEMMKNMMPGSYSLKFLGTDSRAEMSGGMAGSMFGPFIYKGQTGETFMIKDQEKTTYKIDPTQFNQGNENPPLIADMKKDQQIAGYNCHLYRVEQDQRGTKVYTDVWATKEINIINMASNPAIQSLFYPGISGVPLMIEMNMNIQGSDVNMVIKAKSIKSEKNDKSLFEIPAGYPVKPFKAPMMGR
jgi:hypothetical protein